MKKLKNLLVSLTAFFLTIAILCSSRCTQNTGTTTIEGHIALPATMDNKMGLVMVHGSAHIGRHPFAYGIPYHIDDVVDKTDSLLKGDDIQFYAKDNGRFYMATSITKVNTHKHNNKLPLDSTKMIFLDDHKNLGFEITLSNDTTRGQSGPSGGPSTGTTPQSHVFGHIGPALGDGEVGGNQELRARTRQGTNNAISLVSG